MAAVTSMALLTWSPDHPLSLEEQSLRPSDVTNESATSVLFGHHTKEREQLGWPLGTLAGATSTPAAMTLTAQLGWQSASTPIQGPRAQQV